ncbi:MAG TPA: N-acetylglucosamine kinase [Bacteroidia bacterium]|nr:N-acetylglucosamine kinase [Bacteroidia bacterium]
MILIADSGSTKTDWVLVDENLNRHSFSTRGFNPFLVSQEQIENILAAEIHIGIDKALIKQIYFYGAGCSDDIRCGIVRDALKKFFSNAVIEINHDLLGAARAMCGTQKGIVAILGTGSNSCVFDGTKITEQIPSLGYILGDEGSGAYISKKFIAAYLYREMPDDLLKELDKEPGMKKEEILSQLYHTEMPSGYLAGFMRLVQNNISHTFVSSLVKNCFSDFLMHHVCRYSGYDKIPMHCIGSVGFHFSSLLKQAAAEKNIRLEKIIEKPVDSLVDFHLS